MIVAKVPQDPKEALAAGAVYGLVRTGRARSHEAAVLRHLIEQHDQPLSFIYRLTQMRSERQLELFEEQGGADVA